MQRVKGHENQAGVRNGTENNEHENVNSYAHQNYNAMPAAPYSVSNFYGASYYPTYCVGDGTSTWPNTADAITYMGNYNGQMAPEAAAYGMEGMFGTTFGAPFGQTNAPANATSFNYFPAGNTEYPAAWNANASMPGKQYEDYYRGNVYDGVDAAKGIDHRLQNLELAPSDNGTNKMSDPSKYCYGVAKANTFANSAPPPPPEKKTTWASIAKQPAKPVPQISTTSNKKKGPGMPPPPMVPGRHNIDLNTWEMRNNNVPKSPVAQAPPPPPSSNSLSKPVWNGPIIMPEPQPSSESHPHHLEFRDATPPTLLPPSTTQPPPHMPPKPFPNVPATSRPPPPPTLYRQPSPPVRTAAPPAPSHSEIPPPSVSSLPRSAVVDKLKDQNNYNPNELELPPKSTRFFVIKSYSEDDVHRSIKYEIWCSTEHGNKRLDDAFHEQKSVNGNVYLCFSVNGSGHFCGVARMVSPVDYGASSSVWAQDKWKGQFRVRWIYVKDVPNGQLRHIRLENNDNKPVTNSRDTQEVPYDKGIDLLKIIHMYSHTTSIFDDFTHYEKRQEEGDSNKRPAAMYQGPSHHNSTVIQRNNNPFPGRNSQNKDREINDSYAQNSNNNNNRRGGRSNGNNFTNQRNNLNLSRS